MILGEEPEEPCHRIRTLTARSRSYHRKQTGNQRNEIAVSRSHTKLDEDVKVRNRYILGR